MLTEFRRNPGAAGAYNDLKADQHKTDILVKHILNIFNSTSLTSFATRIFILLTMVPRPFLQSYDRQRTRRVVHYHASKRLH